MTWKELESQGRVEPHRSGKGELDALRGAVEPNLRDAALKGLSADNRFALAYEAALLLAKMAVACTGYRVKGPAAHLATFQALELAMGPAVASVADYFDRCRRKRNALSYEYAGAATETEADDTLREARRFRSLVEAWIVRNHPGLMP